jgi:hypothetical protein
VSDQLDYEGWQPEESARLLDTLMFDVLSAGVKRAGDVPVILVNEPIFIAEGRNHLIRYNAFYPRWAYDEYREWMAEWTEKENLPLLDYWKDLPPLGFSDQNFHRSSSGEEQFAKLLAPEISRLGCSRQNSQPQ